MVKRAISTTLPVCFSACVDVNLESRGKKSVLCSIENVVSNQESTTDVLKSPAAKKQRCLELDQGPAAEPLDVSFLFSQARSLLRQPPASSSETPIGREQQSKQIDEAVQSFVASGTGKSIYVSGLPGTGKSHTVRKLLQQLATSQPDAATITWVNCMSISSAAEVHALVAASASGSSNFQVHTGSTDDTEDSDDLLINGTDTIKRSSSTCSISSSFRKGNSRATGLTTYQQLLDRLAKPQSHHSPGQPASSRPTPKTYRATRCSAIKQQAKAADSGSRNSSDLAAQQDASSGAASVIGNNNNNNNNNSSSSSSTAVKTPTRRSNSSISTSNCSRHIIVLDEIDNLAKKSQAELVQLFLLPHEPNLSVLLIGIANSIDLTERTLPELKLKMASPTLICFPAYSSRQLVDILATCVKELPCKLFEPSALELCAKSVSSSSGDLRHALKACRAAVDELERQQQQHQKDAASLAAPAAATPAAAAVPVVNVRCMMGALSRLAGVRSSQFGAQATSIIRSLPNQQQLLLYALSVLCKPKDDAAAYEDSSSGVKKAQKGAAASSLWQAAGSAAALSSGKAGGSSSGGSGSGSVFVLAVGMEEAYAQYRQVCKLLALPPCSRAELQHMAELLAQMALVDIIRQPLSSSASATAAAKKASAALLGSSSSSNGLGGLKAGRGGSKGGLGGLGGMGLGSKALAGGAGGSRLGRGGVGAGAGGAAGQQQELKLSLRPSAEEVEAALRHNPALRCLVQK